jgi:hypothetical protein
LVYNQHGAWTNDRHIRKTYNILIESLDKEMGYRDVKRHSYPLPPQAMSVDDATLLKDKYRQEHAIKVKRRRCKQKKRRLQEGAGGLLLVAYWLIWLAPEKAKSHKANPASA